MDTFKIAATPILSASFEPIIEKNFSFLNPGEIETVAQYLRLAVDTHIQAKYQMQKYAEVLEKNGLRATAPLLLELAGRGSKTAAVEVVSRLNRARFDHASRRDNVAAALPVEHKSTRIEDGTPTSPLNADHGQRIQEFLNESLMTEFEGLKKHVRSIESTVGWLRTTIDTERQLTRYKNKFGDLAEPTARSEPYTDAERKLLIDNFTESLKMK